MARSGCNKFKRADSTYYPNSGGVVNFGEEKGVQVE